MDDWHVELPEDTYSLCTDGNIEVPTEPPPSASSLAVVEASEGSEDVLAERDIAGALGGREAVGMEETDFEGKDCSDEEQAAFLARFGLTKRYFTDVLRLVTGQPADLSKTDFRNKEVCAQNNVVWIYPKGENKAFSIDKRRCHRLSMWSEHACSVQVKRVSSVKEAADYLSGFPDSSIMHLVLGGHGTGRALRWGDNPNLFGVMEQSPQAPEVPVGKVVTLTGATDVRGVPISATDRGYVHEISSKGSLVVYFQSGDWHYVPRKTFESFQVVDESGARVIAEINAKIQRHASLFLDSCKAAYPGQSTNLAQFLANSVGKGVRVIGATVPFSSRWVDVQRFGAFHAAIYDRDNVNVHRVFVNSEARCPDFASQDASSHDCKCKAAQVCVTEKSRGKCPSAGGAESETFFLPYCAEDYVEDRCICVDKREDGKLESEAGS